MTFSPSQGAPKLNERAGLVYAGLGRLFRLLRNTRSAHRPHSLGPAATPGRSMAAVEDTTSSPRGADRTGGERAAGEQYRRQRSWSLASCQEQGPLSRTQQQVLQIARTSISIWHVLAQLLEPPYTRPVRTVVWEGRRREAPPYPDPPRNIHSSNGSPG